MIQVMRETKYIVLMDPTRHTSTKKCMIGTEEYNNKSMRMNETSIICDNNKEFKIKSFSE